MDHLRRRSSSGKGLTTTTFVEGDHLIASQVGDDIESKRTREMHHKKGLGPRPVGGTHKLGMYSGVYVPTCLNILSILMFLRFGFVLGQAGVLGMMGMLIASYIIDSITTFSLSAIASNGTVRGGGAYYLISRSLGPEFGGSIGLVFYMGLVFNTGMNAVGLIDCVKLNFGDVSGNWYKLMPEGNWYLYLWSTLVLIACTSICFAGSAIFVRASNGLLIILAVATFSIPLSALILSPFESRELGIEYTGLSLKTFIGNLKPQLTRGAAGSQLEGKETFQDLFGILFPATSGIFAGASMSGDLRNPSKSIPKGTLYGLSTTFIAYTLVILSLAATITRPSFLRNGTKNGDEPTYAIFMTYIVTQVVMLCNLNQIASFVTMAYLVRKYLLRLRQEHVKFWRPQILLFINDPRRQRNLVQFCNSMKKGGLYILGHVIVTEDFGDSVPEARRQQVAWTKYIDYSKIKAFVNIAIAPGVEWGVRNIVLSAGLGGMRPNIAVLGFYNLDDLRRSKPLVDVLESESTKPSLRDGDAAVEQPTVVESGSRTEEPLPTDSCKTEAMMSVTSYVTILEDLLLRLQINVAVARGFQDLELLQEKSRHSKKYIDLWPIQMSAEITDGDNKNVLTTNFDTYTLILQLGVILNTVPAWKAAYKLRVAVFVEYESDVEEERGRVKSLLEKLRIEAEVLVFWLASGDLPTYEMIVNGATPSKEKEEEIESCLMGEDWWDEIQRFRGKRGVKSTATEDLADIFTSGSNWPEAAYQHGHQDEKIQRFAGLRKLLITRRRHTMSGITRLGVNLNMRAQKLPPNLVGQHSGQASGSEDSGSSDDSDDSDSEAVIDSDGPPSVVSEADMDEYQIENDANSQSPTSSNFPRRRLTYDENMRRLPILKRSSSKQRESQTKAFNNQSFEGSAKPNPEATLGKASSGQQTEPQNTTEQPTSSVSNRSGLMSPGRPSLARHSSQPKFTSKPVPITRVATDDGPGPSIMFTDAPSPPTRRSQLPSAYRNKFSLSDDVTEVPEENDTQPRRGSTYSTQSIPLSFNDLPCKAQHLILNELMQRQSSDTAVLFTTLPSPAEGTCQSVEASTTYLSDLDVLCKGCPPMLMVHSNSMTVTMSL
ncbi:hypothetical protein B7463_g1704, partial [Scytalidium lignicola]